jgi:hypothetical protein
MRPGLFRETYRLGVNPGITIFRVQRVGADVNSNRHQSCALQNLLTARRTKAMERGARRGWWVYLDKGVWMLKFVQLTDM